MELAIVIAIIGILAALVLTAQKGTAQRTRDAKRVADMQTISKAIDAYRLELGDYPAANINSASGWEVSSITPNNFLQALVSNNYMRTVPIDPVNTAPANSIGDGYTYAYKVFAAGSSGCPSDKGNFYILMAWKGELQAQLDGSPAFTCGTLGLSGAWVMGRYANQ